MPEIVSVEDHKEECDGERMKIDRGTYCLECSRQVVFKDGLKQDIADILYEEDDTEKAIDRALRHMKEVGVGKAYKGSR